MALTKVIGAGLGKVASSDLDGAVTINESSADVDFRVESNGNANMLFVDGGNDRVGIGTSSPDKLLHLKTAVNNTAVLRIESTATDSYPFLSLKNDAREYQLTAHGPLGDVFTIYDGTSGNHRFVINSSGNVGIGTSSPTVLLDLESTSPTIKFTDSDASGTPESEVSGAGGDLTLRADKDNEKASSIIGFEVDGSERMRIDSIGNVGIGISSVSGIGNYKILQLRGGSTSNGGLIRLETSDGTSGVARFYAGSGSTVLESNSNTPLTFGTNATERMRINSSGNVGINTTTPAATLHTVANSGTTGLLVTGAASNNIASFYTSGGSQAMALDSSGNVGIGSGPTAKFSVYSGASGVVARIDGPNAYNAESGLEFSVGRARISGVLESSGGTPGAYLKFMTMPNGGSVTERMRIDSSGNLLVGKTNADTTTKGHFINNATGYVSHVAESNASAYLNRLTNDGNIVVFQKDGSTVGSIGTTASKLTIGSGATGVRFNYAGIDTISPWNLSTNALTNGTTSLGYSGTRFKDLWLSGGVYLGGVTSANFLDDYEEGTWTPSPSSGTLLTYQTQWYVKVGNIVTCSCYLYSFSGGTSSSFVEISGLPFTFKSGNEAFFEINHAGGSTNQPSGSVSISGRIGQSGGTSFYWLIGKQTGTAEQFQYGHLGTGHYLMTFSYITA